MCFSCFLGINQNIVVQHVSTLFLLLLHQEMVESSTKYASIVIAEKVEKKRIWKETCNKKRYKELR